MRDYGTSNASEPGAYGFHHSTLRLAEQDRQTNERLDRILAEQSCELCKKPLTDSQRRAGRRCFKHRLPAPPNPSKKTIYTCACGHRTTSKPNSSGIWICSKCRRTNRQGARE